MLIRLSKDWTKKTVSLEQDSVSLLPARTVSSVLRWSMMVTTTCIVTRSVYQPSLCLNSGTKACSTCRDLCHNTHMYMSHGTQQANVGETLRLNRVHVEHVSTEFIFLWLKFLI